LPNPIKVDNFMKSDMPVRNEYPPPLEVVTSMKPILSYSEIGEIVESRFNDYAGDLTELESAIGALVIGQKMGWKVLLLVHDRRTIQKYGYILGVDFQEVMPEVGDKAHKSKAWIAMQKIGNFWRAVKGEIRGIKTPELTKTKYLLHNFKKKENFY